MISINVLAHIEDYIVALDHCKVVGKRAISNDFFNMNQWNEILKKKKITIYHSREGCLATIPYHDQYLDLIYTTYSYKNFQLLLSEFQKNYHQDFPIRLMLIGKKEELDDLEQYTQLLGFSTLKKVARTTTDFDLERYKVDIEPKDYKDYAVRYAKLGEENEIFNLLLIEFQYMDDNIPEIDLIQEHIKKKQIVIVSHNQKIVACHCFELKNGIFYGWYDVTLKEHRKQLLIYFIFNFLEKELKKLNLNIARVIGWRNLLDKRLLTFAKYNREVLDGVYIYTYFWQK